MQDMPPLDGACRMKTIVFNILRALLATLMFIGFLFAGGVFMTLSDPSPNPKIGDPESAVIAEYGQPSQVRTIIPSSPDGWRYTSRYLHARDLPANALPSIENRALWYPCRWGDYTVIYIDKRGVVSDVLDGRS